jgi:hypothetical protein
MDASFWILDDPEEETKTNPEWVALVSEKAGGIVAVGRRDVLVSLCDLLETLADEG